MIHTNANIKLSKQLLIIVGIAFALLFTSLGVILPKVLIPVAEANLYNYLREPLKKPLLDVFKGVMKYESVFEK